MVGMFVSFMAIISQWHIFRNIKLCTLSIWFFSVASYELGEEQSGKKVVKKKEKISRKVIQLISLYMVTCC